MRAAREARIHEANSDGRWKILTIPGAISTRGMIAIVTIEAAAISPCLYFCEMSGRVAVGGVAVRGGR